jgi:hypothetical protein
MWRCARLQRRAFHRTSKHTSESDSEIKLTIKRPEVDMYVSPLTDPLTLGLLAAAFQLMTAPYVSQ